MLGSHGTGSVYLTPTRRRRSPTHLGPVYKAPYQMSCKRGGSWTRPFGDVANSKAGVEDCARKCKSKGYKYFGLECPRNTVHCQCANTLSGSQKQASSQCDRKNVNHGTHCRGPYKHGPYMLGSHGTGSVYLTTKGSSGSYFTNGPKSSGYDPKK